ncbi:MAG TPA: 50S ribosomal protein L13 [Bacteroidia bacterium]|nr:MAG: 50S ribosomal protein L13 [Bacteroidetes bacterium OLB10]MBE7508611.1 50S ribosomal protein L13 [Bacteroidia bacterium]MBX3105789.1 50S ribosomal protein L13 [Bacteroidota bacterium]MCE7955292.1 50S ribosomal protein L13 [Bacteroidetes bacterium CHB6]OQB63548.1 MAG: 50S ribosomal protein L13 [Bacteroidetes bacterium ADurb.Bin141]
MDTLSYKTVSLNAKTAKKEWVLIDATDLVLGRLSSEVAKILRGKHRPGFTPHVDTGDNVIIINAEKVKLTGNKMEDKVYVRHTGYPGGQRFTSPAKLMEKYPERILENAIHKMLPKNRLGNALKKNLRVFAGSEHNHEAQNPRVIKLDI